MTVSKSLLQQPCDAKVLRKSWDCTIIENQVQSKTKWKDTRGKYCMYIQRQSVNLRIFQSVNVQTCAYGLWNIGKIAFQYLVYCVHVSQNHLKSVHAGVFYGDLANNISSKFCSFFKYLFTYILLLAVYHYNEDNRAHFCSAAQPRTSSVSTSQKLKFAHTYMSTV